MFGWSKKEKEQQARADAQFDKKFAENLERQKNFPYLFGKGQKVRHKAGGPDILVIDKSCVDYICVWPYPVPHFLSEGRYKCQWLASGGLHEEWITESSLDLAGEQYEQQAREARHCSTGTNYRPARTT